MNKLLFFSDLKLIFTNLKKIKTTYREKTILDSNEQIQHILYFWNNAFKNM